MTAKSIAKTSAPSVLTNWTDEQLALIKNTIAVGATDDELKLYLQTCLRTDLDPFMRQIYFVKRKVKVRKGNEEIWESRLSIQVSIDGFRAIAARTGKYAGNDDPTFDNEANPLKATVTVYRLVGDHRCPFTATARWSQYYPGEKQGFMWNKMPHLMLGKCAEALALRKAFPEALSGLYSEEEMQQADKPDRQAEDIAPPTVIAAPAPAADASKTAVSPEAKKDVDPEIKALLGGTEPASQEQIEKIARLTANLGKDIAREVCGPFKISGKPNAKQAEACIVALEARLAKELDSIATAESK